MKKNMIQASIVRKASFVPSGSLEDHHVDGRKSFYNKARVVDMGNGKHGLLSYDTLVATVTEKKDGSAEFKRTWGGYSSTTARHVDAFANMFGFGSIGKKKWDSLEIKAEPGYYCGGYYW